MYGIDENGILYIHIKVYKAKQIKSESFIRGGEVTLRCYSCDRYHVVRIRQRAVILDKTRRPRPNLVDNSGPIVDPPSFSHVQ